eukprot:760727-Hanusia_phi.AAC.3
MSVQENTSSGSRLQCNPAGSSGMTEQKQEACRTCDGEFVPVNWTAGRKSRWLSYEEAMRGGETCWPLLRPDCHQHQQRKGKAKLPSAATASASVTLACSDTCSLRPGTTKKSLGSDASTSRISKLNLLRRHSQVVGGLQSLKAGGEAPSWKAGESYLSLKRASHAYTTSRSVLLGATSPFHAWPVNDEELENFTI